MNYVNLSITLLCARIAASGICGKAHRQLTEINEGFQRIAADVIVFAFPCNRFEAKNEFLERYSGIFVHRLGRHYNRKERKGLGGNERP